jgi:hypothetical protein
MILLQPYGQTTTTTTNNQVKQIIIESHYESHHPLGSSFVVALLLALRSVVCAKCACIKCIVADFLSPDCFFLCYNKLPGLHVVLGVLLFMK